ncbi:MAG: LuxR C-terminal-related transcriptional regulator [Gaiellaceae bacterium]
MSTATAPAERIPRALRHIIERPRITRLLDETNARTILLVAPAGFGKTTLARQWLDDKPHGWYRGSTASSDVAALAAGLAKAASVIAPGAGARMIERLGIAGAPPPTAAALAGMLGEDLAEWPDGAWLAIDDYHLAMESEASETFAEELIVRCPVRLLVTSRARPAWATARKMLYGEILEVGRSVLALTHEEAEAVMSDRKREEVAGLMSLTEGWPAVIGLASLSDEPVISEAQLPDTLYEYCAEELFQKLAVELQNALCTIAQAPSISDDLLRALFGKEAHRVAHTAEEAGFVTRGGADYDMHPLLRSFLLRKLEDLDAATTAESTRELLSYLAKARQWDDALAVASRSSEATVLEELLDSALDELLGQGRLETLRQWIQRSQASTSPVGQLAEAEIAFREGDHGRALRLARNAASQMPAGHLRTSRAWNRAGQSAYFLDRREEALELCEAARASTRDIRDVKAALWALFNVNVDVDEADARSLLLAMEAARPLTLDDEIRISGGYVILATRWGGLDEALRRARTETDRLEGTDPMARTGFLHNMAHGLVLAARYEEALAPLKQEMEVAREFSMDFAIRHAVLMEAAADMGLRRFSASRQRLDQATRSAAGTDDLYVTLSVRMFRGRLHLFQGRVEEGLVLLTQAAESESIPSVDPELHACRALALAAMRRTNEAERACEDALEGSRTIEPEVLVSCARAVTDLLRSDNGRSPLAEEAFRLAVSSGNLDSFVCAYRACPPLIGAVARVPELEGPLVDLLERARDLSLGRQVGVPAGSLMRSRWHLTRREDEVLTLVTQGLTNRQIAERLFLAEVTVKVHVRHILAKLGVRTRTEAAVRAATMRDEPL